MKHIAALCLFVVIAASCNAVPAGESISLTNQEKSEVQLLAVHRQDVNIRMQKLQAEFQANLNRLNEEINGINVKANEMCFELKKAHKLDPGANYTLDDWRGLLVKR